MISPVLPFAFLWLTCNAHEHFYSYNVSRSTISGISAYRSALTLDWLAAEDNRQRELVKAFETESLSPANLLDTDCIAYSRPASGKIARLLLELLKNLEGDEATVIPDLIQSLVRAKLLVEISMLESEPDLEALLRTPNMMMGEPHVTFPRILAMTWMAITDPTTTEKYGWCSVTKITKYLNLAKSNDIAKQMQALQPITARARFIMEEFIQHVTPINMYQKTTLKKIKLATKNKFQQNLGRPMRTYDTKRTQSNPVANELKDGLISESMADDINDGITESSRATDTLIAFNFLCSLPLMFHF